MSWIKDIRAVPLAGTEWAKTVEEVLSDYKAMVQAALEAAKSRVREFQVSVAGFHAIVMNEVKWHADEDTSCNSELWYVAQDAAQMREDAQGQLTY